MLVISPGEVKPYKGIEYLIDAVPEVLRRVPEVRFLIAGLPTEHTYGCSLIERAAGLSAGSDRIRFDFRYLSASEMDTLFLAADVCVLPYRRIYQSGVLCQALTYGVPTVVTDVGALGATIRAVEAGIVVPPTSAEELAAGIALLASDDRLRAEYRENALRGAAGPLSWDRAGEQTAALYGKVVS
jgi:glycosyltransferase involved in cell wall biosynthesis